MCGDKKTIEKKQDLGKECQCYKNDILAIHETKIKLDEPMEIDLDSGHKMILFEQKQAHYRGLDFVISTEMNERSIIKYRYLSDRVAYLVVNLKHTNSATKFCIVNAYGPTEEKAVKYSNMIEEFYIELEKAIDVPRRVNYGFWVIYMRD